MTRISLLAPGQRTRNAHWSTFVPRTAVRACMGAARRGAHGSSLRSHAGHSATHSISARTPASADPTKPVFHSIHTHRRLPVPIGSRS